jgi:AraC-like DNA-binding protein
MRFSSDSLPLRDRIAVWREFYGQQIMRVDIEPLRDRPFRADLKLCALPGLKTVSGTVGGMRYRRTPEMVSDGNDNVYLFMARSGATMMSHLGREVTVRGGDAVFLSCGDLGTVFRPQPAGHIGIHVPRAALEARVSNMDDTIARPLPRHSEALGLLKNYLRILDNDDHELTAPLRDAVVNHIYDLTACVIGELRGNEAPPDIGGMRAARLHAIKADIAANFARPNLTLDNVAARHNISPRYVRKLLEIEGTTFTDLVGGQRLLRAYRLLTDPRSAGRSVSEIAFAVGFGDLSYFNRAFRRRFHCTSSQARASSMREA